MSTLNVATLQNSGGTGTAATLASINGGPISGARNRIINGDMRIDQRNAGASVTAAAVFAYSLDRWQHGASQASKFTIQQNAGGVTPPANFTNYLGVTSSSAYSLTAGDYFLLQQQIEGFNFADMAWGTANAQPVTLSFRVYSSLTGTFGGVLKNSASNRTYPFTYSVSSANTWTTVALTVPGDTSGTWVTNNGNGCSVVFGLGVGSTYSGPAGAWAAANYISATGATSVVSTNGATFYITGVQLEAGTVATPFERRSYGQELALCQRYFNLFGGIAGNSTVVRGYAAVGTGIGTCFSFPAQMRAIPTLTIFGGWNLTNVSQLTAGNATTKTFELFVFPTTTGAAIAYCAGVGDYITAAAEL